MQPMPGQLDLLGQETHGITPQPQAIPVHHEELLPEIDKHRAQVERRLRESEPGTPRHQRLQRLLEDIDKTTTDLDIQHRRLEDTSGDQEAEAAWNALKKGKGMQEKLPRR